MTDKEKIIAEIERLINDLGEQRDINLEDLLDFINSLPEEPVSEDLEEEIIRYIGFPQEIDEDVSTTMIRKAAHHFANWQKEQFEKNRLAACDAQTPEEADREWNFVEKMIKEEHRQPTYSDAIEYGMRLQKEQMMKDEKVALATMDEDSMNDDLAREAARLGQKYFPDLSNVWGRGNVEAQCVKQACLEMAEWQKRKVIDKACEWLFEKACQFCATTFDVNDFMRDFKDFMRKDR